MKVHIQNLGDAISWDFWGTLQNFMLVPSSQFFFWPQNSKPLNAVLNLWQKLFNKSVDKIVDLAIALAFQPFRLDHMVIAI